MQGEGCREQAEGGGNTGQLEAVSPIYIVNMQKSIAQFKISRLGGGRLDNMCEC